MLLGSFLIWGHSLKLSIWDECLTQLTPCPSLGWGAICGQQSVLFRFFSVGHFPQKPIFLGFLVRMGISGYSGFQFHMAKTGTTWVAAACTGGYCCPVLHSPHHFLASSILPGLHRVWAEHPGARLNAECYSWTFRKCVLPSPETFLQVYPCVILDTESRDKNTASKMRKASIDQHWRITGHSAECALHMFSMYSEVLWGFLAYQGLNKYFLSSLRFFEHLQCASLLRAFCIWSYLTITRLTWAILISSFLRCGNWITKRLRKLLKDTQVVNGCTWTQTQMDET